MEPDYAYNRGMDDYRANIPRTRNPYSRYEQDSRDAWYEGWDDAEALGQDFEDNL